MKITFNGAARIVTGSCYLIETEEDKILVECGLFQGVEEVEELNYQPFRFKPKEISNVIITHSHMDHCGNLPKLFKEGFKGKVWATDATRELCEIMLHDGAHIQEENALRLGKESLYNKQDVLKTMKHFKAINYNDEIQITPRIRATFRDAGHILGSAIIELFVEENGKEKKLVFSGDLGQKNMPIVKEPTEIEEADIIFIESTYGNRLHPDKDKKNEMLADVINKAHKKGGKLFIPSFAVERTQELLYRLKQLLQQGKIQRTSVYLDSPLAIKATNIFKKHYECYDEETREQNNPFAFKGLEFTESVPKSKKLNKLNGPAIIIAGSGMCTAGRILHHLRNGISNPQNTLLFIGYQAKGTLGRAIKEDGVKEIELFGETLPVKAEVLSIDSFSGHADKDGLLEWMSCFKNKPEKVFVIHGEEESSLEFRDKLIELGFDAEVPLIGQSFEI